MALSQDEQRMLAEIERRLAADDPGLASCLTTFRRPGPATVLRSPRARIIGSLFTVLLVAMVSLMVYAMIPFRGHLQRHTPPTAAASVHTSISAMSGTQPDGTQQPSADASTSAKAATSQRAAASQSAASRSAAPTAAQQAKKPTTEASP
jgi:cytoskeletal protein RodZ